MWRIEPLLGKDQEKNNETTVVVTQRCDKHASTTELLLENVFSTRSVQRVCKEENLVVPVSCKSAAVKKRIVIWVLSSALEAVKVRSERVKLKNFLC
jgi:hypothetical protein